MSLSGMTFSEMNFLSYQINDSSLRLYIFEPWQLIIIWIRMLTKNIVRFNPQVKNYCFNVTTNPNKYIRPFNPRFRVYKYQVCTYTVWKDSDRGLKTWLGHPWWLHQSTPTTQFCSYFSFGQVEQQVEQLGQNN